MIVDIVLKYSVTPSKVKKIGGFYNAKPFEKEDITDYNIKELVKKNNRRLCKQLERK